MWMHLTKNWEFWTLKLPQAIFANCSLLSSLQPEEASHTQLKLLYGREHRGSTSRLVFSTFLSGFSFSEKRSPESSAETFSLLVLPHRAENNDHIGTYLHTLQKPRWPAPAACKWGSLSGRDDLVVQVCLHLVQCAISGPRHGHNGGDRRRDGNPREPSDFWGCASEPYPRGVGAT